MLTMEGKSIIPLIDADDESQIYYVIDRCGLCKPNVLCY